MRFLSILWKNCNVEDNLNKPTISNLEIMMSKCQGEFQSRTVIDFEEKQKPIKEMYLMEKCLMMVHEIKVHEVRK